MSGHVTAQFDHYDEATCGHGLYFNRGVTFAQSAGGEPLDVAIRWVMEVQVGSLAYGQIHRVWWVNNVPWWRRWLLRLVLGARWVRVPPPNPEALHAWARRVLKKGAARER